ncbi:hypothetical protein PVK06_002143 [Gossypium arboreum]|uniref:Uncharacterized protein n=1 Tax=Gossypium arboreum TaxID=29729 RepID=A0ABR0R343_GOSAR|nr:hypothetical protein PVK06_002143 [Gossypium arboreum]
MTTEATIAFKVMNKEFVKLDQFDGSNFNRWKDKMLFLFIVLNVVYVLDPNLQPVEDPTPNEKLLHMEKDFTVEKILSHLRIEEENQKYDVVYLPQSSKVNHLSEFKNSRNLAMVMEGIGSLEICMIIELNIAMIDKSCNWWLDFGATVHVCNDRQPIQEL